MTTHLLMPGVISELATYCGIPLHGESRKRRKGDMLGSEDNLPLIDCADCLRSLLVKTRIKASGMEDNPHTRWLFGGNTGGSSVAIWSVMTGTPLSRIRREIGVPHDPSDFGRCHELLELFPEWRARMTDIGALHPTTWGPMVAAWEELTTL